MTDDVLQNVNSKAKDQEIYGQYYCFHYLWGRRRRWILAVVDEHDFRSQSSGEAIKIDTTGQMAQDGCDKLQLVKSSAGWLVYVIACGINDDFIAVR